MGLIKVQVHRAVDDDDMRYHGAREAPGPVPGTAVATIGVKAVVVFVRLLLLGDGGETGEVRDLPWDCTWLTPG